MALLLSERYTDLSSIESFAFGMVGRNKARLRMINAFVVRILQLRPEVSSIETLDRKLIDLADNTRHTNIHDEPLKGSEAVAVRVADYLSGYQESRVIKPSDCCHIRGLRPPTLNRMPKGRFDKMR